MRFKTYRGGERYLATFIGAEMCVMLAVFSGNSGSAAGWVFKGSNLEIRDWSKQ